MGGTLADKLLVDDGCWKEGLFSLGLRSPGCDSRADAHVHTGSTNWTQWVTKEEVGDDDDKARREIWARALDILKIYYGHT